MGTHLAWPIAAGIGAVGASVAYYLAYRTSRIRLFLNDPRAHWRFFAFDTLAYLGCGAVITALLVEPCDIRSAFVSGMGWFGFAGGLTLGSDLDSLTKVRRIEELQGETD